MARGPALLDKKIKRTEIKIIKIILKVVLKSNTLTAIGAIALVFINQQVFPTASDELLLKQNRS